MNLKIPQIIRLQNQRHPLAAVRVHRILDGILKYIEHSRQLYLLACARSGSRHPRRVLVKVAKQTRGRARQSPVRPSREIQLELADEPEGRIE